MRAVGEQLLAQGADVSFATNSCYERACLESNFEFFPLGTPDYVSTLQYTRKMLEEQTFDVFVNRGIFDHLEPMYAQLLAAASGADIVVAPSHVLAAHLVAEKLGIPYVACAYCLIQTKAIAPLGSEEHRQISASAGRWHSILREFRQAHHLKRRVLPFASPITDATRMLGMLPGFLLSPGDSRLPNFELVGYAEHRQTEWMLQDADLRGFCDDRTVAFAFGSVADACDPAYFLEESVAACKALGLKCVYLSQHVTSSMLQRRSSDVLVRNNLAPAAVFPLVGTAVHHGGSGTLMAACKSLVPMAIVPFFLDQPQQATRMRELIGCANIPARSYNRDTAIEALVHTFKERNAMTTRLRELMAGEADGAIRSAQSILSIL